MWVKRSHVLAPLATLTSNKKKWDWGPHQDIAFNMAKKIIAREVMLAYPDFNNPFKIHTDVSHYQLGAVISQEGKPIAFYRNGQKRSTLQAQRSSVQWTIHGKPGL
jgi:RNase H-like domain found in reverse transcriptase